VTYDALTESTRLIGGAPVAGRERLTRRRRLLAVAVDVDDDIAVTEFVRRAHGGAEWQAHVLRLVAGNWALVGGGGYRTDQLDALSDSPTREELGGCARSDGAGGVAIRDGREPHGADRWLSYATILTTDDVDHLEVDNRRTIARPAHGRSAVVWRGHQPLSVTAVGHNGEIIATLQLR
jgi:hypothetical protein